MNFSASASLTILAHSARSSGVRKKASGDLSQSLYLASWAAAREASRRPATAKSVLFTFPPYSRRRILSRQEVLSSCEERRKVGIGPRRVPLAAGSEGGSVLNACPPWPGPGFAAPSRA